MTISLVMEKINYHEYQWVICIDLKLVNVLLGQHSGYTGGPYFLCLWYSRAKHGHWTRKEWLLMKYMVVGRQNVPSESLVARDRTVLSLLQL